MYEKISFSQPEKDGLDLLQKAPAGKPVATILGYLYGLESIYVSATEEKELEILCQNENIPVQKNDKGYCVQPGFLPFFTRAHLDTLLSQPTIEKIEITRRELRDPTCYLPL